VARVKKTLFGSDLVQHTSMYSISSLRQYSPLSNSETLDRDVGLGQAISPRPESYLEPAHYGSGCLALPTTTACKLCIGQRPTSSLTLMEGPRNDLFLAGEFDEPLALNGTAFFSAIALTLCRHSFEGCTSKLRFRMRKAAADGTSNMTLNVLCILL
jgi:hypothetical protein